MANRKTEYQLILDEFAKQGKLRLLNSNKDLQAIQQLSEKSAKVKEEYEKKDARSEANASNIVIR